MHTVREERAAHEAVNDALEQWDRAADAWDAVTWAVARDPEVGEPLTESGLTRSFTFQGAVSIDMPTVTVVYEIQTEYIVIHNAHFEVANAVQTGNA